MRFNFINLISICGFAFLYLPIIILIIFSFNISNIITSWGGFSFTWYEKLWQDKEIIAACLTSFKVASLSATGAVIIGTLAGLALQRVSCFRGRSIFSILFKPKEMTIIKTLEDTQLCCSLGHIIDYTHLEGLFIDTDFPIVCLN